ncbi:hypothetical protein tinsulaeT_25420 [Thalassotalea insulae]|uniref:PDZ domain-containing protein n=1 Tax=Thalassotalea insulae TaxID=2056778 RepID=A0ABQ6GX63_9GAMM|nr:PDZ domain-containing protein [Thalassotalea insulae]GLX79202.1 hypothetical protein tinsulaeT_25420 [Thalassotalea insulae]
MKLVNIAIASLVVVIIASSPRVLAEQEQLSKEQQEQIKLLRDELEFLASKLLKLTGENEYTLSHPGHELIHFGACGEGTSDGIRINCVSPHTAAYNIGLKSGDLLTEINGVKLDKMEAEQAYQLFSAEIKKLKSGDAVKITFEQKGVLKQGKDTIKSIYSPGYEFKVSGNPKKNTD